MCIPLFGGPVCREVCFVTIPKSSPKASRTTLAWLQQVWPDFTVWRAPHSKERRAHKISLTHRITHLFQVVGMVSHKQKSLRTSTWIALCAHMRSETPTQLCQGVRRFRKWAGLENWSSTVLTTSKAETFALAVCRLSDIPLQGCLILNVSLEVLEKATFFRHWFQSSLITGFWECEQLCVLSVHAMERIFRDSQAMLDGMEK